MAEIKKKQVCKCENCGNEAEMVVTCSLEDEDAGTQSKTMSAGKSDDTKKVKGTATCSHCGNEADMWIDI
jgi:DNA-directed RNA polymerase subunit M/transcription elongation factor TFIIS